MGLCTSRTYGVGRPRLLRRVTQEAAIAGEFADVSAANAEWFVPTHALAPICGTNNLRPVYITVYMRTAECAIRTCAFGHTAFTRE